MKLFGLKNRAGRVVTYLPRECFVLDRYTSRPFLAALRFFIVFLAWLLCAVVVRSEAEPHEISSFNQFYALSGDQAGGRLPLRVRATVICSDPGWSQLYLHDGASCSYVHPGETWPRLKRGQVVELTGQTKASQGGPGWTNLEVAILGEGALPVPVLLPLTKLEEQFGQWIQVAGQVRSAETSRGRLCLTLRDGSAGTRLYVLGDAAKGKYQQFVGCTVHVRGINTSQVMQNRVISPLIIVNALDDITVDRQATADFLAAPVTAVDALFDRELGAWTNLPVHVNGLITAYSPGDFVVVKDPTGVIKARVSQVTRAAPDERVNLWGYLTVTSHGVQLEDGLFELVGPRAQKSDLSAHDANLTNAAPAGVLLTESKQVTGLSRSEAAKRLPVKLRGVITYTDPDWQAGFLQDSTGAVFFDLGQRDLQPGQWIELTGFTDPGGFAPMVTSSSGRILGWTNPPTATRVDLDDLNNGRLDSHWIEIEGVVRRVDTDGFHLFMTLMSSKGIFKAVINDFAGQTVPGGLIDCLVRLRGVCCYEVNSRRQLVGFSVDVPRIKNLAVVEPAPADPFSIKTTSTRAVGQFDSAGVVARRVKVAGTVSMVIPGEGFFLQDSAGGIRVRTAQTNEITVGRRVEALGFAAIGDFAPRLDEAIFKQGDVAELPRARPATAEELLSRGSEDCVRVQIEGRLLQRVASSAHPKLILQSGSIIFGARIMGQGDMHPIRALRPGSMLRVSGVCSLLAGPSHQAEALRLLVNSPEDVQFLSAPPLWTQRQTLIALAIMGAAVLLGLGWVFSLRRQVRKQTSDIHEEKALLTTLIDHLPDNVYVKDRRGRYILSNQAHARFHGVASPSAFRGKSGKDVFPPDTARAFAESDAKVFSGDIEVLSREEKLLNGAGHERLVLTTKVPLRDNRGHIIGLVGFSRDITESRRAELELVEKERALSTLMGNLPGMAYRCRNDQDRTMEFLSDGCVALTGFSAQELLEKGGTPYNKLIHGDDRARVAEEIRQAISRNGKFQLLYRIVDKSQVERWVWEQGLGVIGVDGLVRTLEGFVIDMTERRQADEALRISEERFRAVWEHSIDGMQLTDREGRIIDVNQAFCQLVRQSREVLVGQLFTVIGNSKGSGNDLASYTEQFQSGKILPRMAMHLKCLNGQEKDIEVSSCFVDLGQGGKAVFSILRDVSDRRRVEAILAYERDLLSTLFENLPDALYFKDLQSRFVRVSRSKLDSSWAMAQACHRYSFGKNSGQDGVSDPAAAEQPLPEHLATREAFAEYIIGKTDFDFFDESRARAAFDDEQEIIRSGQPLIGKLEKTTHLDGHVTWALSTKMPWCDKDGRVIGTFGISKDITSIKEAEASVEAAHKQLMEASRQAGMAEVATGVLHNVGNVLNSVNVSATLLSEKIRNSRLSGLSKVAALLGEHSADLADFITKDTRGRQLPAYVTQLAERLAAEQSSLLAEVGCLARNVEHIKNIVAMQQSYARPAGINEPVEPVEVVEDALRINNGSLAKHQVRVLREYQPNLPIVSVDKHKVLQILVNLVSNAGHACAMSPRPDKQLIVRLAASNQRLSIAISDNGVGIAPENLTRIFSLGFTTRKDGHGFGLHSGALAAREIGGTLVSHSEGPGLGATFVLELPLPPA